MRHMAFARNAAAKTAQGLPIDTDDAIQVGYLGLTEAAHRFDVSKYDPTLGDLDNNFKSFAYPRICGAVIDKVRSDSFVKRRGQEKGLHFEMHSLDFTSEDAETGQMKGFEVEALAGDPDLLLDFERAMKTLTPREQKVVLALAAGAKGHELAAEFGISESRISQISTEARNKLTIAMTGEE